MNRMSLYSPSIERLIESFEKLPSIGHKTAARLAFYILNSTEEETNKFVNSIVEAKKNLKYCSKCFNISDTDPCPICSNPKRDASSICVVEDVMRYCSNGKKLMNLKECIMYCMVLFLPWNGLMQMYKN